jgi:hypothetical protein
MSGAIIWRARWISFRKWQTPIFLDVLEKLAMSEMKTAPSAPNFSQTACRADSIDCFGVAQFGELGNQAVEFAMTGEWIQMQVVRHVLPILLF